MLPNFIVIGAPKCGTSSFCSYLSQHPKVFFSEEKEPDFFTYNYEKGLSWYERFFEKSESFSAVGEGTSRIIYNEDAVLRIKKHIPKVKMILLIRDPINRLISEYQYQISRGVLEDGESISSIIRNPEWRWFLGFVGVGKYIQHISFILEHFQRVQLKVFLFEDFIKSPQEVMEEASRFLNLSATFKFNTEKKENVTKSMTDVNLYFRLRKIKKKVFDFFSYCGIPLTSIDSFSSLIKGTLQKSGGSVDILSSEDELYLRKYFQESNQQLSQFLGRDLSEWRSNHH